LLGPLDAPDSLLKSLTVEIGIPAITVRQQVAASARALSACLLLGASLRDEITVAFRYRT